MLLILAALKEEIKPILKEIEVIEKINLRPAVIIRGEYLGKEIIVGHTGIGMDKMYRAAKFCINEYKPEMCINIGFCGALTPNLALGDLVLAKSVVHEKKGSYKNSDLTIIDQARAKIVTAEIKFSEGTMLTVDKAINTPHEKAFLGTKFDAIAVDMESYGLALAAEETKTNFLIVRSVFDPMDMHLPDFAASVSDDGTTNILGLACDIIKHPKDALDLPHMQFCASKALESSMRFVNEIIG